MCRPGDIILVNNYIGDGGNRVDHHSFIVLSDEAGQIAGIDYHFVCNVMSSFRREEHRIKKLRYPGNYEIKNFDTCVKNNSGKDGYVKVDQFLYFNKDKIEYMVIGFMMKEAFEKLIEYIQEMEVPIKEITDNL